MRVLATNYDGKNVKLDLVVYRYNSYRGGLPEFRLVFYSDFKFKRELTLKYEDIVLLNTKGNYFIDRDTRRTSLALFDDRNTHKMMFEYTTEVKRGHIINGFEKTVLTEIYQTLIVDPCDYLNHAVNFHRNEIDNKDEIQYDYPEVCFIKEMTESNHVVRLNEYYKNDKDLKK